jgi:hypothetical protein
VSGASSEELARIRRVADTLCTGHAHLRDSFARRALILDLSILASSTWLVALAFVDPSITSKLAPFDVDARIWVGALGIVTFFCSLVQIKTDWKGRSDAHKRTLEIYAEVKREAGYILASGSIDDAAYRRVLARYDLASAVGIEIPEAQFLPQKRRHLVKVALSKHLDSYPAAWLWLVRLRFWLRDNFPGGADGG